ncbi:hypothetical protein K0M31_013026, partial [Melipona bicolor]
FSRAMAIALARDGGDDDRHASSGGRHRWTSVMAIRQGRWRWSVTVLVVVDDGRVFARGKKVARWKERILGKAANSPVGRGRYLCSLLPTVCQLFFSRSLRHAAIRRNPDFRLPDFDVHSFFHHRQSRYRRWRIKVHASNIAGKIEKLLEDRVERDSLRLASARHGRGRYLCPVEFLTDGPGQPSDQPFETPSARIATSCPQDTLFFSHPAKSTCRRIWLEAGRALLLARQQGSRCQIDINPTGNQLQNDFINLETDRPSKSPINEPRLTNPRRIHDV